MGRTPDGKVTRGTSNGNAAGSSYDRRRRKQWLLDTFGNGVTALCSFGCGTLVDIVTLTVDRFPIPGVHGGTYRRENIRPACGPCNSKHGGSLRSTKGTS